MTTDTGDAVVVEAWSSACRARSLWFARLKSLKARSIGVSDGKDVKVPEGMPTPIVRGGKLLVDPGLEPNVLADVLVLADKSPVKLDCIEMLDKSPETDETVAPELKVVIVVLTEPEAEPDDGELPKFEMEVLELPPDDAKLDDTDTNSLLPPEGDELEERLLGEDEALAWTVFELESVGDTVGLGDDAKLDVVRPLSDEALLVAARDTAEPATVAAPEPG